jgi:hypothetical protein
MKIEIRELMDDNEMLSHIFLSCIPINELKIIKEKYVSDKDWNNTSVKIPINMTIGGVNVNPKIFFDSWRNQMNDMISKKATELISEKIGSSKIKNMIDKLNEYEQIINDWETDINWDIKNPLI